jgi:hypothetical protein
VFAGVGEQRQREAILLKRPLGMLAQHAPKRLPLVSEIGVEFAATGEDRCGDVVHRQEDLVTLRRRAAAQARGDERFVDDEQCRRRDVGRLIREQQIVRDDPDVGARHRALPLVRTLFEEGAPHDVAGCVLAFAGLSLRIAARVLHCLHGLKVEAHLVFFAGRIVSLSPAPDGYLPIFRKCARAALQFARQRVRRHGDHNGAMPSRYEVEGFLSLAAPAGHVDANNGGALLAPCRQQRLLGLQECHVQFTAGRVA